MMPLTASQQGLLWGQAIGDMMGLPFENLSARRVQRLAHLRSSQMFFGYGFASDDTEHAGLTADAILYSHCVPGAFEARLRQNLRRWFLTAPAGIGLATMKACLKMCLGLRSTGIRSAGNGPLMRATVIGAFATPEMRAELCRRSTLLTYTYERAVLSAHIVSELAAVAETMPLTEGPSWIRAQLAGQPRLTPLTENLELTATALENNVDLEYFLPQIGCGKRVSGFVAHTLPVVLHAFFHQGFEYDRALASCIHAGGDTDTTAAIVGGLVGARNKIREDWLQCYTDWPWTLARLREPTRPALWLWPALFARNLAFFGLAVAHLARRLLPPW
ncbi:MAG: ADP-ribosylglycohydrolase family protein [Fimbriiglobus sp.]